MSSGLSKYKEELYCCTRCGTCKYIYRDYADSCPSGVKFRFETFYPSGRIHIGRGLLEGNLEWSERIRDILFACPTCGACTVNCQSRHHAEIVDIIEALRADCVREGFGPLPNQKVFAESVLKEHNPYREKHATRLNWKDGLEEEVPQKKEAEILYFVGCTSSYRQQELAQATVRLLNKLGVDYTVSDDEWCCGSPLMRTGQLEAVKDLVEHNLALIKQTKAKQVLTSCAGCYRTMKIDFPNYADLIDSVEILHITEFLERKLKEGKLTLPKKFNDLVITYHDPCHLGRHAGVYAAPRAIINTIPGVRFVEMGRTAENAWCCGAGGGVKAGYKEWAVEIASERVKEAETTGCSILLSACPFCKTNLEDAIKASGSSIQFMDIVTFLNQLLQ
ncbi:MAG: (Fe-S)-binding protein [Candidatus Helarchaeota archaeon]